MEINGFYEINVKETEYKKSAVVKWLFPHKYGLTILKPLDMYSEHNQLNKWVINGRNQVSHF